MAVRPEVFRRDVLRRTIHILITRWRKTRHKALPTDWHSIRALVAEYDALAVLSTIWFTILFVRYLFPPLFPVFQEYYGVGSAATGLLFSILMGTYALMQFPSGVLADRFEYHCIISGSTIVFSLALFLVVVPGNFTALLVAIGLIGLGTGAYKTVAIHILSDTYPAWSGRAIGFLDMVGQFGGVIAPTVIVGLCLRPWTGAWRSSSPPSGRSGW